MTANEPQEAPQQETPAAFTGTKFTAEQAIELKLPTPDAINYFMGLSKLLMFSGLVTPDMISDGNVRSITPAIVKQNMEEIKANMLAKMLVGWEMNIGAFQALQELHIVKGRIFVAYPQLIRQMEELKGFKLTWIERSHLRAAVHCERPNAPAVEVEFTWEDAVKAGLTRSYGNEPSQYEKRARIMLQARCVSELYRLTGGKANVYVEEERAEITAAVAAEEPEQANPYITGGAAKHALALESGGVVISTKAAAADPTPAPDPAPTPTAPTQAPTPAPAPKAEPDPEPAPAHNAYPAPPLSVSIDTMAGLKDWQLRFSDNIPEVSPDVVKKKLGEFIRGASGRTPLPKDAGFFGPYFRLAEMAVKFHKQDFITQPEALGIRISSAQSEIKKFFTKIKLGDCVPALYMAMIDMGSTSHEHVVKWLSSILGGEPLAEDIVALCQIRHHTIEAYKIVASISDGEFPHPGKLAKYAQSHGVSWESLGTLLPHLAGRGPAEKPAATTTVSESQDDLFENL